MADHEPPQGGGSRRTLDRARHMKRGCDWCRARFENGDRITTVSKSVDLRFHYACGMVYLSRLAVHTERASPWPRRAPAVTNLHPRPQGKA